MKIVQNTILAVAAVTLLSACGHSQNDRALSGAGIGAGVGAVGGALVAGNPVAGAAVGGVVGGAVGATAGALTKDTDINLGKPIWR